LHRQEGLETTLTVHPKVKVLWGSTAVPSRSNHLAWKQSPAAADLTADGRLCQHPAITGRCRLAAL